MNVQEELLRPIKYSKPEALAMVQYIGNCPDRFAELMHAFFSDHYRLVQRAAWPLSHCVHNHPILIQPYLTKVINTLQEKDKPDAAIRNILRLLQSVPIPENLEGLLIEACFSFLQDRAQPVAIRVFAMTVAANVCQKYPELLQELHLIVAEQVPYEKPAFKSRAARLLNTRVRR